VSALAYYSGLALWFVGAALIAAAMLRATLHARPSVWLRGSFQRADDYPPQGWRVYRLGVTLAALGMVLLVVREIAFR
jgi:hypothetical protein